MRFWIRSSDKDQVSLSTTLEIHEVPELTLSPVLFTLDITAAENGEEEIEKVDQSKQDSERSPQVGSDLRAD